MTPFFLILALVLLVVSVFVAYVIVRYVPIIERNAFDVPQHRASQKYALPAGLPVENLKIKVGQRSIPMQLVVSQKPSTHLVVFCHETAADLSSWIKHASFLPEAGYDVVSFSFDENASQAIYQWPTHEALKVLKAVLTWATQRKKTIILFGVSKGSTLALAAAQDPNVAALVLEGIFSTRLTIMSYVKKWMGIYVMNERIAKWLIRKWAFSFLAKCAIIYARHKRRAHFFSIEKSLKHRQKPALVIHAERDTFIRLADVEVLLKQWKGQVEFWNVRGATHSEAATCEPVAYKERILNFLASHQKMSATI